MHTRVSNARARVSQEREELVAVHTVQPGTATNTEQTGPSFEEQARILEEQFQQKQQSL